MFNLFERYQAACKKGSASAAHLPTLANYSKGCDLAIEFGCKFGDSATALLMGAKKVISYDIVRTKQAESLKEIAGDRWDYRIEDTTKCKVIPECDLLFVDSLHTYGQVRNELFRHAQMVRKWLIFHDTITFGSIGAKGETGKHDTDILGIRPAIDHYMIENPRWTIHEHYTNSHGLLVLRSLV